MCQFCHHPHIHDYPHPHYEMPPHAHYHHPHPPVAPVGIHPNMVFKRPNVYNSIVAITIQKDVVTVLMDDGIYYQSPVSVVKDVREEQDNSSTPNP